MTDFINSTVSLNDQNFKREVLESDQPVLVEFSTDWCGLSQIFSFMLKDLMMIYKDHLKLCRIDYVKYEGLACEYGVHYIPTILLFKNGKVVDHVIGGISKNRIMEKLDWLIGNNYLNEE